MSPNPSKGIINIKGINKLDAVNLYNSGGQLIKTWVNPGNEFFVNDYRAGIHFLQIKSGDKIYIEKLMLIK